MKFLDNHMEKVKKNVARRKIKKAFTGSAICLLLLSLFFWPCAIWYWYAKQVEINE